MPLLRAGGAWLLQCSVEDMQGNVLECVAYLNPGQAARALDQFRQADPRSIRNKGDISSLQPWRKYTKACALGPHHSPGLQ